MTELDDEIELDVMSSKARRSDNRYAVTNNFGIGGHNVAVVFGAY